jgi:methylenetetrahydrofolate reductase (NADPH)
MHINEIFERDGATYSFEFFPPKSEQGWDQLFTRIQQFKKLAPSFVSVTYGAGGSTRLHTQELVVRLREEASVDATPHLACVGHSRGEIEEILESYAKHGISNILGIRGDAPRDERPYDHREDEFSYAVELVRFIKQFNESGRHPHPKGFGVLVAGFPEGHPDTPNRLVQLDHLKAKVDAGADCIVSQMFFDNAAYYDWVERCRLVGINAPIIAGIMPITSLKGMKRMADLAAGTNFPAPLQRMLYRCQDDPEAVRRVGIHWATEQCRDLIDRGVDGIHFYTLNQSDATTQIYQTLGARDSSALREPDGGLVSN